MNASGCSPRLIPSPAGLADERESDEGVKKPERGRPPDEGPAERRFSERRFSASVGRTVSIDMPRVGAGGRGWAFVLGTVALEGGFGEATMVKLSPSTR